MNEISKYRLNRVTESLDDDFTVEIVIARNNDGKIAGVYFGEETNKDQVIKLLEGTIDKVVRKFESRKSPEGDEK